MTHTRQVHVRGRQVAGFVYEIQNKKNLPSATVDGLFREKASLQLTKGEDFSHSPAVHSGNIIVPRRSFAHLLYSLPSVP